MEITSNHQKNHVIFSIKGNLHQKVGDQTLKLAIQDYIENDIVYFGFDFSETTYFNSAIVNLLFYCYKQVFSRNGTISLIAPNFNQEEALRLVGIHKISSIYSSEEDFVKDIEIKKSEGSFRF